MNQQACRESSFYVGWMRGMLVYDNSLSPNMKLYELFGKCSELYDTIILAT